jgi:hypothetical protein
MIAAGSAMQPSELLRAITAVAQTGGTPSQCEALARETEALADMVGWATGPIDASGQLLERVAALQDDLRLRHAQTSEPTLALLHDALTDLGRAIARHDGDLEAGGAGEDEGEDFT